MFVLFKLHCRKLPLSYCLILDKQISDQQLPEALVMPKQVRLVTKTTFANSAVNTYWVYQTFPKDSQHTFHLF